MIENAAAENALGTIGAVCWTIQIIPQLIKSYRTKDVEGLSAMLMFIWAVSSMFLGVYAICQNLSVPIILQPQSFGLLSAISVAQCMYYGQKRSTRICVGFVVASIVIMASFEVGMVWAVRAGIDRGVNWPVTLFGSISAALLAGALIPQYWEIYRLKEVKGISLTFMVVDMMGGIFCTLSLAFRSEVDIIGTINYSCVVVLDLLVLVLAMILNSRAKRRRRRALDGKEGPVESVVVAEPGSSMERQPNDTLQQTREEKRGPHHHIGQVVSKEKGETSYSIDPVSAAINDTSKAETHEQKARPNEVV